VTNVNKQHGGSHLCLVSFPQFHISPLHTSTMVRATALVAATAALAVSSNAESLYGRKSAVLQVTGMDYDRQIAKSNYTSVRLLPNDYKLAANNGLRLSSKVTPNLDHVPSLHVPDSTRHGAATARTFNLHTRRPPSLSPASPRSPPSTAMKR
jgi:hypothetical protein